MHALAEIRKPHLVGCAFFWAWALVGVGYVLGFLAILSVGLLLIVLAGVATFFLVRRQPVTGAFGLLSGAGLVLLLFAYLNRSGPGDVCSHTATSVSCGQQWDPIPWLVAGLVCFTAGVAGHAWRSRRL